jgi:hypothetical protein
MLMALSMAGLGGAPAAHASASLATQARPACPATVGVLFGPAAIHAHSPMTVQVSVALSPHDPSICALGIQYLYFGLPPGCAAGASANFACVPSVSGTFHVQTTVVVQNTATTVVDTLVVL